MYCSQVDHGCTDVNRDSRSRVPAAVAAGRSSPSSSWVQTFMQTECLQCLGPSELGPMRFSVPAPEQQVHDEFSAAWDAQPSVRLNVNRQQTRS